MDTSDCIHVVFGEVDVDSAISFSAIRLSTIVFIRLGFLAGGHSKLLDAERFLRSVLTFCTAYMAIARSSAIIDQKLSGVQPLSRALPLPLMLQHFNLVNNNK